jgi:hypothetical protein
MLTHALAAREAGLCVIPPKGNGSKAPLIAWKGHQHTQTTVQQLQEWYADESQTGIGAVLGKASKNVELLEFDDFATYDEFVKLAHDAGLGDLVHRIEAGYCEETPNGVHWLYRCDVVEQNQKLARRLKSDDEREHPNDNIKALIETRGEGGYVVLAPTHGLVHPSHKPYTMRSGSYGTIGEITPAEREQLFNLARSLDAMPRTETEDRGSVRLPGEEGERPGDYFNRTRTWADVLTPHGWREHFTRGDETYWTRPGRERVISATTNYAGLDLLKVFSTSTEFDTTRTYSKFGAHTLLNYGGDFGNSARAIRLEMPKAERSQPTPLATGINPADIDLFAEPGRITAAQPTVEFTAPEPQGDPEYNRLKSRMFTTTELFELPPPEWLIEGIMPKNALAVLWGQSGSYKSFLALDWALCIATGSWWKRRKIDDPADVLYVVAEGSSGIPKRVRAWSKANGLHKLDRVRWIPEAVDILNDASFRALSRLVVETQPEFVVIDTLARSIPGADENSAQDMGRLIERCDQLKKLGGGTVLLVHHSTKEGSVARGSGSLRNAVDVEMEMKHEGTRTIVYNRKQKDAAEFDPIPLHLVVIDDSCVLSNVSQGLETNGASSQALETARQLFRETFGETGVAGAELRNVIEATLPTSRSTAYRLINDLVASRFISNRATASRPFYEPGEDYHGGQSSQRLTNVSHRLNEVVSTSHTPRGSIEPEGETDAGTMSVQVELWSDT